MKVNWILLAAASAIAVPAHAQTAPEHAKTTEQDVVTTGVAKGRDRLDSATSTSSLREAEIARLAPRSVGELLRDIPGIFAEAPNGESIANITIRGLPLSSSGAKFVQLQEDGLPVMEFGDILGASSDSFMRVDLNLAQVEAIRGGSASTFASNSPGGIINFISKTGEQEGGAVALTAGLDFDQYRADFDYGGRLASNLRFHIGGFYRQGEGPRRTGFDGQKGGQIKANVTREFAGGYIRFYGKYLDDRSPFYEAVPFRVTGTNEKPALSAIPNFDPTRDTLLSSRFQSLLIMDGDNRPVLEDMRDGQRVKEQAFGLESQFGLADWTITERFRIAGRSGGLIGPSGSQILSPAAALTRLGATGGTFRYANGPNAGQVIADPSALNGNGLIGVLAIRDRHQQDIGNITNDIRASRVWEVAGGSLTTTAGWYSARQSIDTTSMYAVAVSEIRGGGDAALLDVFDGTGVARTQNGIYAYNALSGTQRRTTRLRYTVNAPFASANFRTGRLSVGASLRYDRGTARGTLYGVELGQGRVGQIAFDLNGDSTISSPERRVGVTPNDAPAFVDYDYGYLSYSASVNFRVAEPFSAFARYSRGARANADRLAFGTVIDAATGRLTDPSAAYDPVKQAELGVKFRQDWIALNLTAFHVESNDTNVDNSTKLALSRRYRSKGLEFEGRISQGLFSLAGGATYTTAEIVADRLNAAVVGNTPRHQANLIFQATPQISNDRFAVGAVFIGTTKSFAQDSNLLRMPGYVTTNAFVQVRPVDRLLLSLNATNLFDVVAVTSIEEDRIPATGLLRARLLNGRAISATARFDF